MKLLLPMPLFRILAVLAFLECIHCQKSFGIEPGFYSNFPGYKDAKPRKLLSEIGEPDQRLDFHSQDEIRIPPSKPETKRLGDIEVEVIDERKHKTLYVNQKHVEKALKSTKPKNLLIAWFDKWMMMEPEKMVESLQPFFCRLSYRRVVVLGACSAGVFVVQDKTYSETTTTNK